MENVTTPTVGIVASSELRISTAQLTSVNVLVSSHVGAGGGSSVEDGPLEVELPVALSGGSELSVAALEEVTSLAVGLDAVLSSLLPADLGSVGAVGVAEVGVPDVGVADELSSSALGTSLVVLAGVDDSGGGVLAGTVVAGVLSGLHAGSDVKSSAPRKRCAAELNEGGLALHRKAGRGRVRRFMGARATEVRVRADRSGLAHSNVK